ncbi:MAG: CHC2 zinc finger domain-containing protein [Nitrospiraceae bacterium]
MKLSPDDIRRARSVNLIELLIGLGHKPVSRRPDHALFHSPLRDDRHPSFSVSRVNGAWVWYDFGPGTHGDGIEFIQQTFHLTFPEAVCKLLGDSMAPTHGPSRSPYNSDRERRRRIDLARQAYHTAKASMTPQKEKELRQYFLSRKVPYYPQLGAVWIARGETNTPYIGFPLPGPNAHFMQGLECRALHEVPHELLRTTIGIKSPWIVKRKDAAVLVTESILDCLAGDALFGPTFTLCALNGIGNVGKLPEYLTRLHAKIVYLALDNDPEPDKGPKAQQEAIALLTGLGLHVVEVRVHHQAGVKDLHKLLLRIPTRISPFRLTESGLHHRASPRGSFTFA